MILAFSVEEIESKPTPTQCSTASEKERWRLVQEVMRTSLEKEQASRVVGMRKLGAWMKWEQPVERKDTWIDIEIELSED